MLWWMRSGNGRERRISQYVDMGPGIVSLRRTAVGLLLLSAVLIGGLACENAGAVPPTGPAQPTTAVIPSTGTPLLGTPGPTATVALSEVGHTLFQTAGCANCHGQNAQGSPVAPALEGISADEVRQQVRHPKGTMPQYSPSQLSDADLDAIAAFVASLATPTPSYTPARPGYPTPPCGTGPGRYGMGCGVGPGPTSMPGGMGMR